MRIKSLHTAAALLLLPAFAFAVEHKVMVSESALESADVKETATIVVPVSVSNDAGLMAMDLPLSFNEGVTLEKVTFEGTRAEYFDLKISNIDNEANRVLIGLVNQTQRERRPELASGTGVIANLHFTIDDPAVKEIVINATKMEVPKHELTFIYRGESGMTRVTPGFTPVSVLLGGLGSTLPTEYALNQNYPNPFNPSTEIAFALPNAGNVKLVVYNTLGQEVNTLVDTDMPAGNHTITWDGRNRDGSSAATGLYFYRLTANGFESSKKMMLIK